MKVDGFDDLRENINDLRAKEITVDLEGHCTEFATDLNVEVGRVIDFAHRSIAIFFIGDAKDRGPARRKSRYFRKRDTAGRAIKYIVFTRVAMRPNRKTELLVDDCLEVIEEQYHWPTSGNNKFMTMKEAIDCLGKMPTKKYIAEEVRKIKRLIKKSYSASL